LWWPVVGFFFVDFVVGFVGFVMAGVGIFVDFVVGFVGLWCRVGFFLLICDGFCWFVVAGVGFFCWFVVVEVGFFVDL
jgi:hypothetical protein